MTNHDDNYKRFETGGRIGLEWRGVEAPDGSIGCAPTWTVSVFDSAESREYFIQFDKMRLRAETAEQLGRSLIEALRDQAGVRGAWRNLLRALRTWWRA